MSLAIQTVDRNALPDALLSMAKTHMRVDHSGDDDYIKGTIARAIARFQSVNGVTLNPTTAIWTPAATEFSTAGSMPPMRPVNAFAATAGDPPGDVTASYSIVLKWDDPYGIPIQILQGDAADGLSLTLELGFTDETIPIEVLDVVLLEAAHLYNHREILMPDQPYAAPNNAASTWWMPRV
jgi:hypothetical protein